MSKSDSAIEVSEPPDDINHNALGRGLCPDPAREVKASKQDAAPPPSSPSLEPSSAGKNGMAARRRSWAIIVPLVVLLILFLGVYIRSRDDFRVPFHINGGGETLHRQQLKRAPLKSEQVELASSNSSTKPLLPPQQEISPSSEDSSTGPLPLQAQEESTSSADSSTSPPPPPPPPPPPHLITSTVQLQDYHKKTKGILTHDVCKIYGPGLGSVVVGKPTSLKVVCTPWPSHENEDVQEGVAEGDRQNASSLSTTTRAKRIVNPWTRAEWGYATFENNETVFAGFSGHLRASEGGNSSSIITTTTASGEEESFFFKIYYTPTHTGNFTLSVDLLTEDVIYPFYHRRYKTVQVVEDETPPPIQIQSLPLPACASRERAERSDGTDGPLLPDSGRWFRCTTPGLFQSQECLRWGYTFRPSTCYYENWQATDLQSYATAAPGTNKKQWIVVMGTSRVRGVFLSAVDQILDGRQGELSSISKCWGRMDVQIGSNLRLTYQDFRGLTIVEKWPLRDPGKGRSFQCHDDHVATSDAREFYRNSTEFLANLFQPQEDGNENQAFPQPTALVFEYLNQTNPEVYKNMVINQLPAEWDGPSIAIHFRGVIGRGIMDVDRITNAHKKKWAADIGRPNTDVIDIQDIMAPWMRTAEFGTGRASQHWHHTTTTDEPILVDPPFGVVGLVTDTLAQMVFNRVLGSKGAIAPPAAKHRRGSEKDAKNDLTEPPHQMPEPPPPAERPPVTVCTDCPASLLPFHIKPRPDMVCYDHLPGDDYKNQYDRPVPACPGWCMAEPVTEMLPSQSGEVEVRECVEKARRREEDRW